MITGDCTCRFILGFSGVITSGLAGAVYIKVPVFQLQHVKPNLCRYDHKRGLLLQLTRFHVHLTVM